MADNREAHKNLRQPGQGSAKDKFYPADSPLEGLQQPRYVPASAGSDEVKLRHAVQAVYGLTGREARRFARLIKSKVRQEIIEGANLGFIDAPDRTQQGVILDTPKLTDLDRVLVEGVLKGRVPYVFRPQPDGTYDGRVIGLAKRRSNRNPRI